APLTSSCVYSMIVLSPLCVVSTIPTHCLFSPTSSIKSLFFFFNHTATTEIYTLSLHDALPIFPKHLFQGYLNIYNNYFKAPWMPDRTEANPNELNQDDARYGFRCCHLKNIWTAPLPPETELSRQMTTSTTSIDIMGLQAAY